MIIALFNFFITSILYGMGISKFSCFIESLEDVITSFSVLNLVLNLVTSCPLI